MLGLKKLKKFSNKFNIAFKSGYDHRHFKGNIVYFLTDIYNVKYILLVTKEKDYIIRKLPANFGSYEDIMSLRYDIPNKNIYLHQIVFTD